MIKRDKKKCIFYTIALVSYGYCSERLIGHFFFCDNVLKETRETPCSLFTMKILKWLRDWLIFGKLQNLEIKPIHWYFSQRHFIKTELQTKNNIA